MKGHEKLSGALKLDKITPRHMAQLLNRKAMAASSCQCKDKLLPMKMNITFIIRASTDIDFVAYEEIFSQLTRRCGSRATKDRREKMLLSKSDYALIRKNEAKILYFIAASPENAALFVYDPMAALRRLGNLFDGALLDKLRAIYEAGGANATVMPNLNIASLKIKVEKKTNISPRQVGCKKTQLQKMRSEQ